MAGKIVGVVNGSRFLPALPKIITTPAFQASATHPITTKLYSSDIPRLVFGEPPTLDEAKDATLELRSALHQAYLSNESSGGSYVSDAKHDKLEVSDSAPKYAIQAFRLLKENPHVQTVVASIASDPKVWEAMMHNETLLEFLKSQNIDSEIPCYRSPKYSDNEMFDEKEPKNDEKEPKFDEKEPKNGFNNFFEDIEVKIDKWMNSIYSFLQNLFAGPGTADESSKADKTIFASIMEWAVRVIVFVVFKRFSEILEMFL